MDYYGREPSSDFFMHYGVKGMKWGVRKAIEKGDAKRLGRQYAKARRKLDRLNSAADITTNERRLARNKKIAAIGSSVGGFGAVTAANQILKTNDLLNKLKTAKHKMDSTDSYSYIKTMRDILSDKNYPAYREMHNVQRDNMTDYYNKAYDFDDRYRNIKKNRKIGLAIGAAGLGTVAVAGGRAALAKYRTTKKGHAKAIAKRDAFKNAMVEVFNDKEAQKLSRNAIPQIQKAADKSVRRNIRETLKNNEYKVRKAQKQAKRRARLERKIGRI